MREGSIVVDDPATLPDLARYALARDALLARIVDLLQADRRVGAAWLSGSFGGGEADVWSDLDLHIAVEDAAFSAFLKERPALYEGVCRPLLIQPEIPSNAVLGGHFQLII